MSERAETNGQESAIPSKRRLVERLYEKIARLHASVQALRRTSEELEADRQQLLEENRSLRRRLTVSMLVEGVDRSEETTGADDPGKAVPPPADRLYQLLPSRFSFPSFFQTAANEQIETVTARHCLAHYLAEGRLVQSGAYLEKTD